MGNLGSRTKMQPPQSVFFTPKTTCSTHTQAKPAHALTHTHALLSWVPIAKQRESQPPYARLTLSPTHTHTQTERSAKTAQRLQCWRRLRLRRSNIDSAAEQRAELEWVCVRGRERDSRRDDVERSTVFSWLCFSFAICVCVCFPSARDEALRVCAWKCALCLAREILFSMTCCTRAPWQFYSSLSARICNNVPRKTLKERKTYVSQCSAKLKIEVQKKYKNKKY